MSSLTIRQVSARLPVGVVEMLPCSRITTIPLVNVMLRFTLEMMSKNKTHVAVGIFFYLLLCLQYEMNMPPSQMRNAVPHCFGNSAVI